MSHEKQVPGNGSTGIPSDTQNLHRPVRVALRHSFLYDLAVTYKMVLSSLILLACFYHRQWLDFGIVFVSTGLMLVSEMFNTTIEALCDFVEPAENHKIGVIKDIASAAAGISILVWAVVIIVEVFRVL